MDIELRAEKWEETRKLEEEYKDQGWEEEKGSREVGELYRKVSQQGDHTVRYPRVGKAMANVHYVVSEQGRYGILYVNDHGHYFIVTPKRVYPSGKGFAKRWVNVEDIPGDIREKIDKAFERRKAYLAACKEERL